jgi:polar amino acid transport system substrate-binding protein
MGSRETRRRRAAALLAATVVAALVGPPAAAARSLAAIRERGALALCAHANALPFASKHGNPPGFQIELAEALATALGVQLRVEWVTTAFQFSGVDCDIVLDSIAVPEAQAERRIRLSRPYQRSGVALVQRPGTPALAGFADLGAGHRVAVQSGSVAAMLLERRGTRVVPFGFEDDMLEALSRGEVDAAAVSPASAGYFNLTHAGRELRLIHAYDAEPELAWNLAVGMRRADDALREAVDRAVERLLEDGTLRRIYARYGIEHRPPLAP